VAEAKGFSEIGNGGGQDFSVGGRGHGDLVGKPGKSVGVHSFAGAPSHTGVAAVALQVRAHIPAIDSRGIPSAALAGLLVDDNMGSERGKRVLVVVVGAMQLGPSRELGVEPRGAEQIESEDCLRKQQAPMVERKVRVAATEAGNEVVLEGLDGAFGGIPAVDVGRSELVGNIFILKESFE